MKWRKTSIYIFITSLLLCGNAFAKPDSAPPVVDVNVVNTPLDVTVVDGPSSQPLNFCKILTNSGAKADFYEVPAGQRLVIEYISISVSGGFLAPDAILQAILYVTANGTEGTFDVGQIHGDKFVVDGDGRLVKIHADPGTTVQAAFASNNVFDNKRICFSGQLSPDS